jgi:hypothetical protein
MVGFRLYDLDLFGLSRRLPISPIGDVPAQSSPDAKPEQAIRPDTPDRDPESQYSQVALWSMFPVY